MRWLALLLLAGCDDLFNLEPVTLLDGSIDAEAEACPASYVPLANTPPDSRYRFVSLTLTWDAAEVDCENDTKTKISHLVVFDDVAELEAIKPIVSLNPPWQVSVGYARDTIAQGGVAKEFYGVTETAPLPLTSPLWYQDEPDNGGATNVEETTVFIADYSTLIDGPAMFLHEYICECDHRPPARVFHTID